MSKSVLIIGDYKTEGADCFDWFEELPNLEDYDTVILDTVRIFSIWDSSRKVTKVGNNFQLSNVDDMDRTILYNIALVRTKLLEILRFDVSIYALFGPSVPVDYLDPTAHATTRIGSNNKRTETNDWCPISLPTNFGKGNKILIEDSSYKDYFTDFTKWEYYIDIGLDHNDIDMTQLRIYYEKKWHVTHQLEIIATSKAEKPIAISISPRFHYWRDSRHADYTPGSDIGGSLILLPVANPHNTRPHIEFLLKRVTEVEETPPPSWVNDIEIPGEASYKAKLSKVVEKLKKAETEVESLNASLQELQKYKRLLYDTGLSLQEISKQALHELGVEIKPSVVTDEFIIEIDNKEALIEVKGKNRSVHKRDIAQLITDLGEHLKATDNDIKGILIGNAWRLEPLADRDASNKPVFTRDVEKIAKDRNIGLLSTVELFKAYCKVLEEPDCRLKILGKIIGSKGIIRL